MDVRLFRVAFEAESNSSHLLVAVKTICHAALGAYMLAMNHKRDKDLCMRPDMDEETNRRDAETRGMLDQTEFENKEFRYVL